MGFDLQPLDHDAEVARGWFRANIGGWSFLRGGLKLLGANTSSMAGTNDGDVVDKATAKDWARRLQEGMDSGRLKIVSRPGSWEREVFSLEEGEEARTHELADFIQSFIDFCEYSGGFAQW